jgi:hypothetical protein
MDEREWMRRARYCVLLVGFLFLWLFTSNAQTDSVKITSDTTIASHLKIKDALGTINKKPTLINFQPTKSPLLAMGLSAAVPGLGQIYDENYWKPPIIWAVGGYWIYEWLTLNKNYKDFRNKNSQNPSDQYVRLRDFYRDERDKFAWFLGALYVLNIVDAYAGAHLYDFDVSPELAIDGRIVPKVTASMRFQF